MLQRVAGYSMKIIQMLDILVKNINYFSGQHFFFFGYTPKCGKGVSKEEYLLAQMVCFNLFVLILEIQRKLSSTSSLS